MNTSKELQNLFDDLQMNAYNSDYHTYYYKDANQIIRKHFERFEKQVKVEPVVKPACENCRFWFISPLDEESKRLSEDDTELREICNCEQSFVCDMPTYNDFGCIKFESKSV